MISVLTFSPCIDLYIDVKSDDLTRLKKLEESNLFHYDSHRMVFGGKGINVFNNLINKDIKCNLHLFSSKESVASFNLPVYSTFYYTNLDLSRINYKITSKDTTIELNKKFKKDAKLPIDEIEKFKQQLYYDFKQKKQNNFLVISGTYPDVDKVFENIIKDEKINFDFKIFYDCDLNLKRIVELDKVYLVKVNVEEFFGAFSIKREKDVSIKDQISRLVKLLNLKHTNILITDGGNNQIFFDAEANTVEELVVEKVEKSSVRVGNGDRTLSNILYFIEQDGLSLKEAIKQSILEVTNYLKTGKSL